MNQMARPGVPQKLMEKVFMWQLEAIGAIVVKTAKMTLLFQSELSYLLILL